MSSTVVKRDLLSKPRLGSKLTGSRSRNQNTVNKSQLKVNSQSRFKSKNSVSGSRIESRFKSRFKGSTFGGSKYKSGYNNGRKRGSSKYSTVRENGDPIIFRDEMDVTPLPIQLEDNSSQNQYRFNNNAHNNNNSNSAQRQRERERERAEIAQCFIPLTHKICHPMSFDGQSAGDPKLENNNSNHNASAAAAAAAAASASSSNALSTHLNPNASNTHPPPPQSQAPHNQSITNSININIGGGHNGNNPGKKWNKNKNKNNKNRSKNRIVICTENDSALDLITDISEFEECLRANPRVLDETINITIAETDLRMLFEMPCLAVSNRESSEREKQKVIASNQSYATLLLKHSDQDLFSTSETQTCTVPMKQQAVSVKPPVMKQQSTQATKWDIFDAFNDEEKSVSQKRKEVEEQNNHNHNANANRFVDLSPLIIEEMNSNLEFKRNLCRMERAIIQNVMAEEQMLFRLQSLDDKSNGNEFDSDEETVAEISSVTKPELRVAIDFTVIDPTQDKTNKTDNGGSANAVDNSAVAKNGGGGGGGGGDGGVVIADKKLTSNLKHVSANLQQESSERPHLQKLWQYSCNETKELSCTCLDYNPLHPDLIVGGYGSWRFANRVDGKIMFWTLKNPTNPSRTYTIENSGVVSLNFSRIQPYLLACGLFDGNVAIFDIRLKSMKPILKSELNYANSENKKQNQSSSSKHTTAVWNVLWEKPCKQMSSQHGGHGNNGNNGNLLSQSLISPDNNNSTMNGNNTENEMKDGAEMNNNNNNGDQSAEAMANGGMNSNSNALPANNNNHHHNTHALAGDALNMNKSSGGGGGSSKLHQRQKLFSIASDGIIKQWSMKKGFISSNIMRLKRIPNLAALRGSVIDNTIRSREASGLCFDFPVSSSISSSNTQYYVGTEDGIVHKCSVSYNEQVLKSYYGHTRPVYRIECNPFNPNIFLTCSADWTVKIWEQSNSYPILDLKCASNEAVIDCCWSTFDSCIFASSSKSGILSIWNLESNKKDACIQQKTDSDIKHIMFANNANAILSAHENGNINVFRLNNINANKNSNQTQNDFNQVHRLNKALESEN